MQGIIHTPEIMQIEVHVRANLLGKIDSFIKRDQIDPLCLLFEVENIEKIITKYQNAHAQHLSVDLQLVVRQQQGILGRRVNNSALRRLV